MRDVSKELLSWWESGKTVAMGTVTSTWMSSPRQPGASMLVGPDGTAVGSVSGGCVEGAVYEMGLEALSGADPRRARFGVSDDDAFSVGLTCGGIIDVFVESINEQTFPELGDVIADIDLGRPVAIATVVDGIGIGRRLIVRPTDRSGTLGTAHLDDVVTSDVRTILDQGATTIRHYGANGEQGSMEAEVFVTSFAPRPRMIVFGAIDFASAVAKVGSFLGFHVTVCDARSTFATRKRFPDADEIVVDWPHRYLAATTTDQRTVLCVLTHDAKFDIPLLELALALPVAYVGAMGSRRTHNDRLNRLRELGVAESKISRLASPIGLDIGARTPEETAISIAAELIAVRCGGTGQPLRSLEGPVHREAVAQTS
ncbi:MAG: XdhC family protein [Pseudonocardia sp.]|nr:MAG: XdhC family protein [Pseudonocardia sp.]